MTAEIKKHILVEKVTIQDWDQEFLVQLVVDGSRPEIPTLFKDDSGKVLFSVSNSDIPKLCEALMLMHMDL